MNRVTRFLFILGYVLFEFHHELPAQWSTTNLPSGEGYRSTATAAGGKVFFAGKFGGGETDVIDVYDTQTNTWALLHMSLPRYILTSTSAGNLVFFAGGVSSGSLLDLVEIYNISTSEWTTASLSQARDQLVSGTIGTKVFFAGGRPYTGTSDVVDIFDTSTGQWTVSHLSQPRTSLACATLGTRIFFAGGYEMINNAQVYSDVIDIYNLADNTWSVMHLSEPRGNLLAAANDDAIVFSGGHNGQQPSGIVDVLQINQGGLVSSVESLSQPRNGLASAALADKILIAGGYIDDNSPTISSIVDIYNTKTKTWSTSNLPSARVWLIGASTGGRAFFAGGIGVGPVFFDNYSSAVDIYEDCQTSNLTATFHDQMCQGNSQQITVTGGMQYEWTPSAELSEIAGGSAKFSPLSFGHRVFKVTDVNSNSCTYIEIDVHHFPGIQINSTDLEICSGESTKLTASGGNSYQWGVSPDISNQSLQEIIVSPSVSTKYSVAGTSQNGCASTAEVSIKVNSLPNINIESDNTAICQGSAVNLKATGANEYKWSPAETLSSTNSSTVIAKPLQSMLYTVKGTDINNCSNTNSISIAVNPIPEVRIESSAAEICKGGSSTLTASGASTYLWETASGISDPGASKIVVTPSVETKYSVKGTDKNGCADTVAVLVKVNQLPTIEIKSSSTSICTGASVDLSAAGASTYRWSPSETLSSTTGSKVIGKPLASTVYSVEGTDDHKCSNTKSISIVVNPLPTIRIESSGLEICRGNSTALTASGANTYFWTSISDISDPASPKILVSPSEETKYAVEGTDKNGCANIADVLVKVHPLPVVEIESSFSSICAGASIDLVATGASTYKWSPSETLSSTLGSKVIGKPSESIVYSVEGTDDHKCSNTKSISIIVHPLPNIKLESDRTEICEGAVVNLAATGAIKYKWSPTETLLATEGSTVTGKPLTGTTYWVEGTDINNCINSKSISITVNPIPNAPVISVDKILISNFENGNQWFKDNKLLPEANSATLVVKETGKYSVQVTINGCTSELSEEILVEVKCELLQLFPNPGTTLVTLTLNGLSVGEILDITVYDLTGRIVNSPKVSQASMLDATDLPRGVYFIKAATANQQCFSRLVLK